MVLYFADDLTILSVSHEPLNNIVEYWKTNFLHVNEAKTKLVVFFH